MLVVPGTGFGGEVGSSPTSLHFHFTFTSLHFTSLHFTSLHFTRPFPLHFLFPGLGVVGFGGLVCCVFSFATQEALHGFGLVPHLSVLHGHGVARHLALKTPQFGAVRTDRGKPAGNGALKRGPVALSKSFLVLFSGHLSQFVGVTSSVRVGILT